MICPRAEREKKRGIYKYIYVAAVSLVTGLLGCSGYANWFKSHMSTTKTLQYSLLLWLGLQCSTPHKNTDKLIN